jgi:predicted Zn-dependent protease
MSRRKKPQNQNKTPPQGDLHGSTPAPSPATETVSGESPVASASKFQTNKIQKWSKLVVAAVCCIVGVLVLTGVVDFGGKRSSKRVEQARKMLQINRPQMAVEALANEDSAEGHYLKAVALQALKKFDPAREQINEAVAIAPNDSKYQGYQLVLQLAAGKAGAIEELAQLYQMGKSSPGVALFATQAFTKQNPPDVRATIQAFDIGMTLIDETPEFMFSALHFAINSLQQPHGEGEQEAYQQKVATAERLIEKLEEVAPNDPALLKELLTWAVRGKLAKTSQHLMDRFSELQGDSPDITELRIMVDLMLGNHSAAIATAQQAVTDHPGESAFELMLADVVMKSPTAPDREKILSDLALKRPENPEFVAKLALYLAKTRRVSEAVTVINRAMATTKGQEQRAALLKLAVGIPLEADDPILSEQQVAKYKAEFHNPKIVDYFEGRVLFLKNDMAGAKARFEKVLADKQINNEPDRILAAECLIWQQRIQVWQIELAKRNSAAHAQKSQEPGTTPKIGPEPWKKSSNAVTKPAETESKKSVPIPMDMSKK